MLRLSKLDDAFEPLNSLDILSCEICHKIMEFADAKVNLSKVHDIKVEELYGLFYGETLVFAGYVYEICDDNGIVLFAKPTNYETQRDAIYQKYSNNGRFKLSTADLIAWNSVKHNGKYILDGFETFSILDTNVFTKNLSSYQTSNICFDLVVRWSKNFTEIIDAGSQIFANGNLETFTPAAILNGWPSQDSTYQDFRVLLSNLQIKEQITDKIQSKAFEKFALHGDLVLQRDCEAQIDENWKITVNNKSKNTEQIKLYLNLDKYLSQYPKWKPNTFYYKDAKAIFGDENEYEVKVAMEDHRSGDEPDDEKWNSIEDLIYYNDGNVLFDLNIGQDILKEILRKIGIYLLVNRPEFCFEFSGPWNIWHGIEVGDIVVIEHEGQELELKIIKYQKVFTGKHRHIRVVCNGCAKHKFSISSNELLNITNHKVEQEYTHDYITMFNIVHDANDQKENFPEIKSTKIAYWALPKKRYGTNQVKVDCDWN